MSSLPRGFRSPPNTSHLPVVNLSRAMTLPALGLLRGTGLHFCLIYSCEALSEKAGLHWHRGNAEKTVRPGYKCVGTAYSWSSKRENSSILAANTVRWTPPKSLKSGSPARITCATFPPLLGITNRETSKPNKPGKYRLLYFYLKILKVLKILKIKFCSPKEGNTEKSISTWAVPQTTENSTACLLLKHALLTIEQWKHKWLNLKKSKETEWMILQRRHKSAQQAH